MGTVDEVAGASVASTQPGAAALTVFAAPATGTEFNTIGERLVPKACFKIEDLLFEFGSSFVRPEIGSHLPALTTLRAEHKVGTLLPPLSIFGHADPVGNADNNKKLSGRRATAIYAMFVRDVDLWEELFSKPVGQDDWGTRSVQHMLSKVQSPIAITGQKTAETNTAIKTFQTANGLTSDGVAGPATRKILFRAYMDALCGPTLLLDKQNDFLAQNADAGGKGDRQGCSEFNPLMMFSKSEAAVFESKSDKTERNQENAPNRRVMILLFAPGRKVKPDVWPCPRVTEGIADCKKRFFPDAATRRSFQTERREFEKTKDTFACRFYQIVSDDSPCERVHPVPVGDEVGPVIEQSQEPQKAPVAQQGAPGQSKSSLVDDGAAPNESTQALFGGPSTSAAAPTKPTPSPSGAAAPAAAADDGPLVGPAFGFVLVRKVPGVPRQAFKLRVDKPFDGKGTLTVSPAGKINFFKPGGDGKTPMTFTGDNVFDGADLSKPDGVVIFGEGVTPSAKKGDITLTFTLSGGTKKVKPPASMTLTSVELSLDIAPPPKPGQPPKPLPSPDKLTKGVTVFAQGDPPHAKRAVLIVGQTKPASLKHELAIHTLSGKVDLFDKQVPSKGEKPKPGVVLLNSSSIPAAGKQFFVEGKFASEKDADATYSVGILTGALGTMLADSVALTVVEQNWIGKLFYNRTWDYDTSGTIAAVKEFLPMAKVEVHGQAPGESKPILIATTFLEEDGKFEFKKVPELEKAFFRVLLEHKDGKVVKLVGQVVKGSSTPVNMPDFKVKAGQIVSFDLTIDPTLFVGKKGDVALGDVELKHSKFPHYCDAYKSIWFGHKRLFELTEKEADAPLCEVKVPEDPKSTSFVNGKVMHLLDSDFQDRDVILHEYGHFIGNSFLAASTFLGYGFNDDKKETHSISNFPRHAEHYESAWDEGFATFLSCALQDNSIYRDGHEGKDGTKGRTIKLTEHNSSLGAHNEANAMEALWHIFKDDAVDFKKGFWTAFTATPNPFTVFAFFDNWKAKGCPEIAKVVAAYKDRNMEFGYRYPENDKFKAVAAPKSFDAAKKEFRTVAELFTAFGNVPGNSSGTLAEYENEFYNRNRRLNASALGPGSKVTIAADNVTVTTTIKLVTGATYIVPRRIRVEV
jgi:hypothetical protein